MKSFWWVVFLVTNNMGYIDYIEAQHCANISSFRNASSGKPLLIKCTIKERDRLGYLNAMWKRWAEKQLNYCSKSVYVDDVTTEIAESLSLSFPVVKYFLYITNMCHYPPMLHKYRFYIGNICNEIPILLTYSSYTGNIHDEMSKYFLFILVTIWRKMNNPVLGQWIMPLLAIIVKI